MAERKAVESFVKKSQEYREKQRIKRIGRTGKDGATDTKPHQVTLDQETFAKALRIGETNLSLGVRIAVKAYPEKKERR